MQRSRRLAPTVSDGVLVIEDLHAYYGHAHVLQGVGVTVGEKAVTIIGRNGMGKSTLCYAVMGMLGSTRGSVRFGGRELLGEPPHKIARAGLGFVPQGRRLFRSLSTDEHLRIVPKNGDGEWTPARIYEIFPRLAERKKVGAGQLSGGEQQMLAIGRALVANPKLLVLDEPSEGLAPKIVEELIETMRRLSREGMGLLIVEQNLGVATALAELQLVMVAGRIEAELKSEALTHDPELQRRYLGVTPLAD
jgi:branched-chain amino acid transport system ATP-binding protein